MGLIEKEEKKIIVPISSCPTRIENFKKIAIKFKKLKNIIMALLQAKTSQERQRKREKKNYRSDQFQPIPE